MSYINCSLDDALALLNKWKGSSVFVILTGTVNSLDDEALALVKFSSLGKLEECDSDGLSVSWPTRGRFSFFFKGASFLYSEPNRTVPAELWTRAGGTLTGGLQIVLPFGVTCVVCEVSES
jgi:hypothetical protein